MDTLLGTTSESTTLPGSGGSYIDAFGQLGYAMDVEAPPTAEAIGELVHQALAYARFLKRSDLTLLSVSTANL